MRSKLAERHDGALLGPGAHWPWPAERSTVAERRAGSGRGGLGGESGIFFNFGALPPKSDCQIGGNALLELRAPKMSKWRSPPLERLSGRGFDPCPPLAVTQDSAVTMVDAKQIALIAKVMRGFNIFAGCFMGGFLGARANYDS